MRGSLASRSFIELLSDLYRNETSGCIEIKHRGIEKAIFLNKGSVFRAQSNQDHEKLGKLFLNKNKITEADLDRALTSMKQTKSRLGESLIRMGIIQEPDLREGIVEQIREILLPAAEWEDGEFNVFECSEFQDEPSYEELSTAELIHSGMKRVTNVVLIARLIGDLQGIVKVSPEHRNLILKLGLNRGEKEALDLLKNPISLNDLVRACRLEKLHLYRFVASIAAVGGLVRIDKQKVTAEEVQVGKPSSAVPKANNPATERPRVEVRRHRNLIGEILVQEKLLTEQQLLDALTIQSNSKEHKPLLGSVIVHMGFASEDDMANCLATKLKIDRVYHIEPTPEVKSLVPITVALKYLICPVRRQGATLEVAMLDPTNIEAMDDLSFITGLRIQPHVATTSALKQAWTELYGYEEKKELEVFRSGKAIDPMRGVLVPLAKMQKKGGARAVAVEEAEEKEEGSADEYLETADLDSLVAEIIEDLQIESPSSETAPTTASYEDAPVVKLVNKILRQAIAMKASDIHIEPWENKLLVRYRLDGTMHKIMNLPSTIAAPLISRIKVISALDISEKRRPQEGRVKVRIGNKRVVDHRVSVVPSLFGESIVLRILDRSSLSLDMGTLGFDYAQLESFKKAISEPYGMILCTGPTGSGKTTTLYSALNSIDFEANKVLTVEDPVEYSFPGIIQVQVNEPIGVTFPNVLRYFLRQDPDIMLVGEVRDQETAEICAKAALTGHLVLSTVHTNDAPSAIGRLTDLGLKQYLISACLLMVIAQRLVRKICPECKKKADYPRKMLLDFGFTENEIIRTDFFKGAGCAACGNTGYRGRVAIYEILPITKRIKAGILDDLSSDQLKEIAVEEGMKDLKQAAQIKVKEGITTVEEAMQNTISERG